MLRAKWLEQSKNLYGDFKPSNKKHSLNYLNKKQLPDMVGEIKRHIINDWSDINFIIGTNPDDLIEIRFDSNSIDSIKGLHTYMNNLINLNDLLIKYQLRKISEYWGL